MTKKILLTLILTVFSYAQQQTDIPWPTLADSPWPMMAHDPQITGRSPYSGPKSANIRWTIDLPYGVYSGPIIGEDGTLYVGTNSYLYFIGDTTNYFYAIDPNDGKIKWTFLTGTPYANESGYLINNEGTIFFGSQSGWLYAIDTSGNLKWKYNTGDNIHQSVMNTDLEGNIYIANASDSLFSFSKEGQLNWKVKYGHGLFPKSVTISPDGNNLYIVANNDSIYVLNLDGGIKNIFGINNNVIDRQPLLIDNSGNIYLLSRYQSSNGALVSFDSSGNINWLYQINHDAPGFTDSSPAMDYDGNIYYTYSIDSGSTWYSRIESVDYLGNFRWYYQFNQPRELINTLLIVDKDGTVYCGSTLGYYYYAISSEGELLWRLPLDGYQVDNSGAIGSDGTLYFGTHLSSVTTGQEKTLIAIEDTVTSVENNENELLNYTLEQNYPNPFNSTTNIKYSISQSGRVSIKVFDLLGRELATLLDRYQEAGSYDLIFQADNLASGIYFYQLQVGNFVDTKKLILLK
jgi:outer membrane protein assembly factor BamB